MPSHRALKYPAILLFAFVLVSCSSRESARRVHPLKSPAESPSGEPFLTTDGKGKVLLSWIAKAGDSTMFQFSTLHDTTWTQPHTIASGHSWFVNWADYPLLARNVNHILAHFLDQSGPDTYAYDIKITASSNGGENWSTPYILNTDKKEAEHGFVSILPFEDGFFVCWLDGRNTVMEGMGDMKDHEGHHGAMSLRAAILNAQGEMVKEWELDNRTCDCCQTGAALTDSGPIVVYRDRSASEIRDISVIRYVDGSWTQPVTLYADRWKIAGCPVNGPRVVAAGKEVAVAWFTAAHDSTQVKVVFSHNGGKTFDNPVLINETSTIGRVDLDWLDAETVVVSWMEGDLIKLREVKSNGGIGPAQVVARNSSERAAGFPQLVVSKGRVLLAWTNLQTNTIQLATYQ